MADAAPPTPTAASTSLGEGSGDDGKLLQVIDENGEFVPSLGAALQQWDPQLLQRGFDYFTVAILGAQSSGKSTLLNVVFHTRFPVMDADAGRTQTTKGVWVGKAPGHSVYVLDVEGTDSRERGEDGSSFERKTSLFSLALAEVLIINMWANDIGRNKAANYDILKTVFELNLQLFQRHKKHKTLLLFVIRDHVRTPLEKLTGTLEKDMREIWQALQKPADYRESQFTDFFDLDYVALPHKEFDAEGFVARAQELRDRFLNLHDERTLFRPSYRTDVPADGLAAFAQRVWETIKTNRDLDLPTEKEMLAMFRCEELMEQALVEFRKDLAQLQKALSQETQALPEFGAQASRLLEAALAQYDAPAARYHREVANKKREALRDGALKELQPVFEIQLRRVRQMALDVFERTLHSSLPAPTQSADAEALALSADFTGFAPVRFVALARQAQEEAMSVFHSSANESLVEGSGWDLTAAEAELSSLMTRIVSEERQRQLSGLAARMKTAATRALAPVGPLLDVADVDMWQRVARAFHTATDTLTNELRKQLAGFELPPEEEQQRVVDQKETLFASLKDLLKARVSHLDARLTSRFDQTFSRDDNGFPREWRQGDDIRSRYVLAKARAEKLIDLFSILRLEPSHASLSHYPRSGPRALGVVSSVAASSSSSSAPTTTSSSSDSAAAAAAAAAETTSPIATPEEEQPQVPSRLVVLTYDDCEKLREYLNRHADSEFRKAVREQESHNVVQQVPAYLIVILIILGWNEFMAVVSNPVYLVLTVFMGVVVFVLAKLNMLQPALRLTQKLFYEAVNMAKDHYLNASPPTARDTAKKPKTE